MSLICQGFFEIFGLFKAFTAFKKAAIKSLHCADQFPIITMSQIYLIFMRAVRPLIFGLFMAFTAFKKGRHKVSIYSEIAAILHI